METKKHARPLYGIMRRSLPVLAIAGTLLFAHKPPVPKQAVYAPTMRRSPVFMVLGYDMRMFSTVKLQAGKAYSIYSPTTAVKRWNDNGYSERSRQVDEYFTYAGELDATFTFPQKPAELLVQGKSYAREIQQAQQGFRATLKLDDIPTERVGLEILVYYHPLGTADQYKNAERYVIELQHLETP